MGTHTVGLKSDGTVVAVGNNGNGQCDVSSWTDIIQVAAGHGYTVGLKSDGTVVAVGNNVYVQCEVSSWTDIIQVAAGHCHTVGLKSDGTVVAVGSNSSGECKCDGRIWTDITQVAAGDIHTVGLKSDSTVVAVGWNGSGQCDVNDWEQIELVAAGHGHTVGQKWDNRVVAVGDNTDHQCDIYYQGGGIVQVAAGGNHTVTRLPIGEVIVWGNNDYHQCDVDDWTDICEVAAGSHDTVGLRYNGTVAIAGSAFGYFEVINWTDIKTSGPNNVAAGLYHTVGVKTDGSVVAAGCGEYEMYNKGQCDVDDWTDIIKVAAGGFHTVGLKSDGSVVAVGDSSQGQTEVTDWSGIIQVAAGAYHTVGLKGDGMVVAVGDDFYGQCDIGWHLFTDSGGLEVEGDCPIDLEVTDPEGFVINKQMNEILAAIYMEDDINGDGDPDDQIKIAVPKMGNYQIKVIPETDAEPTDTYTLRVSIGGVTIIPAENVSISDIPTQPYIIVSTDEGIHVDNDVDGISDDVDNCQGSNLEQTIKIDGCDSGVENFLFEDGCTMSDLIAECADSAKNHGKFVSCVSHLTNNWKKEKLIKGKDKGSIQRYAAHANIP